MDFILRTSSKNVTPRNVSTLVKKAVKTIRSAKSAVQNKVTKQCDKVSEVCEEARTPGMALLGVAARKVAKITRPSSSSSASASDCSVVSVTSERDIAKEMMVAAGSQYEPAEELPSLESPSALELETVVSEREMAGIEQTAVGEMEMPQIELEISQIERVFSQTELEIFQIERVFSQTELDISQIE